MVSWARTANGWAVNLDGTSAAAALTLPRIELHSGHLGWTGVCLLQNGTSRRIALGSSTNTAAAMRGAIEDGLLLLEPRYESDLRALLLPRAVS